MLLLLLMVVVGIRVFWQRSQFPGRWEHTFHVRHAELRDRLSQARKTLREVEKELARAYSEAESIVSSIRGEHEQRVARLKREVERLQFPGCGEECARLGKAVLHEHVLLTPKGCELPLDGLRAEVSNGVDQFWLYLYPASHSPELVPFRHHRDPAAPAAPAGEIVPLFTEEQVRGFEMTINVAAAAERRFRAGLPARLAQAEEELAEARKDTDAVKAAEQNRTHVMDSNRNDPRLTKARAGLAEARSEWERETLRRPPK
ncbi:hypothetical protein [Streptomyces sp. CFMR 7]|uniref:hypothetical protein n=1 Tax=Streptomyces sp. CFMR 7 TaxID=1649184 RepID=UPI0021B530E8|nr:hypothetical protein [Streptomyces sp. CFMR 7]